MSRKPSAEARCLRGRREIWRGAFVRGKVPAGLEGEGEGALGSASRRLRAEGEGGIFTFRSQKTTLGQDDTQAGWPGHRAA